MTDLFPAAEARRFYGRQAIVGLLCLAIVFVTNEFFHFTLRDSWGLAPFASLSGLMLGEAMVTAAWLVLGEESWRQRLLAAAGYVTIWWIAALMLSQVFRLGQFLDFPHRGGALLIVVASAFGMAVLMFACLRLGRNCRIGLCRRATDKQFQFTLRMLLGAITIVSVLLAAGTALRSDRWLPIDAWILFFFEFFGLATALPILWAALAPRGKSYGLTKAVLIAVPLVAEPFALEWLVSSNWDNVPFVVVKNVVLFLTVLAHCLTARYAGYRLA